VRLAFVVQRYGADITGGSESLARAIAERLVPEDEVTVFTTCARDHLTWRNEMPEGTQVEGGVRVRRFACDEERDLQAFNAFAEPLYQRHCTDQEEAAFLRRQGPYCPRLISALRAERQAFDARVFFTYLYYTTWEGLRLVPERSLLVPTTHDEPPLRFRLFAELFASARAFAFLTRGEEGLVRSRFSLGSRPSAVAGIGVDDAGEPDTQAFCARTALDPPFVLYAGRIDAGKGCLEMLDFFDRYRRQTQVPADLVLIGKMGLGDPLPRWVRYLGFLSDQDKLAAMKAAKVVICPSPFESLSIVLLEALGLGTPVLACARSPVLLDHCRSSNAGLWYENADEFVEGLDLLVKDGALAAALGQNGRRYVREHYRWDVVLGRWRALLNAAARSA
jgi:glycosyltransferase involved in cell wall biosynthesis